MWKRFPEVLGLDNTYQTNRFKLYLFQVVGVTDQRSLAQFGFGLINTEKQAGYEWLCKQLDSIRRQLFVSKPGVVITDKEKALKNTLASRFPDAQQQLCVFHMNSNVRARIRSRWTDPNRRPDQSSDVETGDVLDDDDNDTSPEEANRLRRQAESGDDLRRPSSATDLVQTPLGMYNAWRCVVFSETEEEFNATWKMMHDAYLPHQRGILRYIEKEYMPLRYQWAMCYIKRYRNFGQRVNSPAESSHKTVKSLLVTGTGDLLHLHTSLKKMIDKREREYTERAAKMAMKLKEKYSKRDWLGNIRFTVSYDAVRLISFQYRLAAVALPTARNPVSLPPCTGNFTQQFALPCSHLIHARISRGLTLSKRDVHPRWWLEKPLVCLLRS